jgi:hypothetical protein
LAYGKILKKISLEIHVYVEGVKKESEVKFIKLKHLGGQEVGEVAADLACFGCRVHVASCWAIRSIQIISEQERHFQRARKTCIPGKNI